MVETHKIILENIKKAQEKQKKYYDQKTKDKNFEIGDLVVVETNPKFKIDKKYIGPLKIVALDVPNTVVLVDLKGKNESFRVNLSRVKVWHSSVLRDTVQ